MDLTDLHHILGCLAAVGQSVDARWLESFDAFVADVTPLPESLAKSNKVRFYRIDANKGWTKANVGWAEPSGPIWPCDEALGRKTAARLDYLRREARRQNSYVYEMREAA